MDEMSTAERILRSYRNIAMVGASANPKRPSCIVNSYLSRHGYNVIPVNPRDEKILGKPSYPDLSSIPEKIDVVDIFRRSEDVLPVVDEAIRVGAKAVWMQEGIVNEAAAAHARQAGLLVVMDRCMRKEYLRLHKKA